MTTTIDTTTEPKYRTITLTGRAPVRIREDQWPQIAVGRWHTWDNQYEFQANRTWDLTIRVRQQANGKAIVYGVYDYESNFQDDPNTVIKVGLLGEIGDRLPQLIERVGDLLRVRFEDVDHEDAQRGRRHIREVVAECIGDLPSEEI